MRCASAETDAAIAAAADTLLMLTTEADVDAADEAVPLTSRRRSADAVDEAVIEAVADADMMNCVETETPTATEAAAAASMMLPSTP